MTDGQGPGAPEHGRRVTSTDVAKHAGVSRATVSYVLNDRPDRPLPEATRRKVLDAARELGYVPNQSARALRGKLPPVILALSPALPHGRNLAVMTDTLTALAREHGYSLVSLRAGDAGALEAALQHLQPQLVLALAVLTAPERAVLDAARTPTAPAPGSYPGGEDGDPVAHLQVRHLRAAGHEHLAYLGAEDPDLAELDAQRRTGIERACAAAGLPAPRTARIATAAPLADLRALLREWRTAEPPVTAVACYNDLWAAALLHAAREEGVAVPGQLAVIGIDDEPMAAHLDPPLTTIDHDSAGIARAVFAEGLAVIDPAALRGSTVLDGAAPRFRVVERGSV